MVIAIIGENCSGKSALAKELESRTSAEVITGKDYLRLAKSPAEAERLFREKLASGDNIIYVISEREQLELLPEGCFRILVTAELDTIKQRFSARMNGQLPPPVEAMLERKHGMFDREPHDLAFRSDEDDLVEFAELVSRQLKTE